MIFDDPQTLKERIESLTPRRVRDRVVIHEDTSAYMNIEGGNVLRLDGNDYFVLGDAREGRFGIDDQPKFWVKYAIDLATGDQKIVKLVFHEQFTTNVGLVRVRCTRNPHKESAVLDLVRGNDRFMQGRTVFDPKGNAVRIIDFIRGPSLYGVLEASEMPHEQYWHEVLPGVMRELIPCIEAMAWLHASGQHHGDIRNDHILIERESGRYTWIDFDYEVNFSDYDVWSMGNVLTYVVGQGMHVFSDVHKNPDSYPHAEPLDEDDALILYKHRIANLRKLFPHVSKELNEILMRFSFAATDPYEDLKSQVRDLRSVFGM
jgi:hypothetical protein